MKYIRQEWKTRNIIPLIDNEVDVLIIENTPFKNMYYLQPWLWQFIKQKNGCVPTYHQWIIFQKN